MLTVTNLGASFFYQVDKFQLIAKTMLGNDFNDRGDFDVMQPQQCVIIYSKPMRAGRRAQGAIIIIMRPKKSGEEQIYT
jgi:hypothetical protein